MNSQTLGLRVASVIFGIMGLAHLIRILAGANVQVSNYMIGRRWSAVAVFFLAGLCSWLWRVSSQAAKAKTEPPPAKPAA
ncbi:MAG: hypothetical protein ACHQ5A_12050 [Opitutales bacterium]